MAAVFFVDPQHRFTADRVRLACAIAYLCQELFHRGLKTTSGGDRVAQG